MSTFYQVFQTKYPLIGMIHFMPLLGFQGFSSMQAILDKALQDLTILNQSGVHAIMVENNYDLPHTAQVGPETVASMTYLTNNLRKHTSLPLGVSVLWNDYQAALAIAKVCGATFIRIPVFVDDVRTSYGDIFAVGDKVKAYQRKIQAEHILLLTDIHVKHAKLLSTYSLQESALCAIKAGSDGIIITGKWTADAPLYSDLKQVRAVVGSFPLLIGSGADATNIQQLLTYADGVIVSTSLKTGKKEQDNVNIKGYNEGIDEQKAKAFVAAFKKGLSQH